MGKPRLCLRVVNEDYIYCLNTITLCMFGFIHRDMKGYRVLISFTEYDERIGSVLCA